MFGKKKDITLIAVTTTDVVRAEVAAGKRTDVKSFERTGRPVGAPLSAAVELGLALGDGKASDQTVVLAEDFWTGALDVDERAIYGLEGEELLQMLKFEAETLANLDPMTSHMGYVELSPVPPDTRRFWCVALSAEALVSISSEVEMRGGKLAYFGHPLGLSGPGTAGMPWIEFRDEFVGAFAEPVSGGMPQASIVRPSATSDRWYRSLEATFKGDLPPEGWVTKDIQVPLDYTGSLQSLADDVSLEKWLAGVARRLQQVDNVP